MYLDTKLLFWEYIWYLSKKGYQGNSSVEPTCGEYQGPNRRVKATLDVELRKQIRWGAVFHGIWTETLIANITEWMERQYVRSCLPAFLELETPQDDAEHNFLRYRRWTEERWELMIQLQEDLQPQTIIGVMLRGQECWNMVAK
ncbi:hypothetical protein J6590_004520 [Homalodisca vitripennis]|nr:hypothetical protein J6590_004520 [Homalodisca vitripennis]